MLTKRKHRTATSKIISDEQRQSHQWAVLVRKLRNIGLNDTANRLEKALSGGPSRNRQANEFDHLTHF